MYNSILLLGVPYSGKDYIAEQILGAFQKAGLVAQKWQVGDYYYSTLSEEIGVPVHRIKAEKPKYRDRLQAIGNDPESITKGIEWASQRFDALRDGGILNVVVARKDNEIEMLKEKGAFVIYISVSPETIKERALKRDNKELTDEQLNHPVERKLEDVKHYVDFVLHNNDFDGPLNAVYDALDNRLVLNNSTVLADFALEMPQVRAVPARSFT